MQICLDYPAQDEGLVGSESEKESVPERVCVGVGVGGYSGKKRHHFLYDALDFYNVFLAYILKSIDPLKSPHLVLSCFVLFSYGSFPSLW